MMSPSFTRLIALLIPLAYAHGAHAHAAFDTAQVVQNTTARVALRISHGCKGAPTNTVRITIPDGIIAVKPMPKAGWTLATTQTDYATPYTVHGKPVANGVKDITWSGGALLNDHYDEFVFQARFTDKLAVGSTVFIPVVQECANGREAWVEIPTNTAGTSALKSPAPGIVMVAQAKTTEPMHGHSSIHAGSLMIARPWSRATPGGAKVAGGFMTITNHGKEPDRLLAISSDIAGIHEIHEMIMDGSMMKMRALEKGIEIQPGKSVELKPGGLHVMFIDLKAPFVEGNTIKSVLTFEKAGKVAVEFQIEKIGASSKAHQSGHGEHKH